MEPGAGRPKLPKNYRLIYGVLCAQAEGHHAAASEIHAAARQLQPGIGYSTVYRALDRLRDLGLVLEVRLPGSASALYEPARPGHAHFHCVECGCVEDVDYSLPVTDLSALAQRYRIEIDSVVTTFNGFCDRCRSGRTEGSA
ncbi:Fur family transcriptional regulator [Lichenifustis flavocetrariae]|uniref:Ferric uptake regulation protein n=1 Tax=Lichenifustis flavocetrariae TaxID=2949735 RepID=A0AA42CKD6_9HYPH|nr:transcriptional repressor [Lichenifustis flavocetrariae]MCW6510429.1 transcriptional repressor [Lichenifustis flavocetrariae]